MLGTKRSTNRSRRDYFLDAYYRVVILAFLITFGATLALVLIQLGTRGAIKASFAQTGGSLESSASVPPNPINLLNEKLRQKETALTQKETELQREESRLTEAVTASEAKILAYMFAISGALFSLILFNFFFDYKRSFKLRQDSQMKL